MPPRVGSHMSIAGGVDLAVERAAAAGCDALQVFTKSSNQWKARALRDEEVERFRSGADAAGLQPVVAHDSYLINVASPDDALREKSIEALAEEVARCERLGIPYLVMHPGSHVGSGLDAGLERIAAAVDEVLARDEDGRVTVLLENTAGQGTNIGHEFAQLAAIVERIERSVRVGVCIDTAHAFAAGYDIGSEAGFEATLSELDRLVGLGRLKALHVNDSKKPLASRVDRHEHVGLGLIPLAAFVRLMNDPRLDGLPAVLETPKTDGGYEDEQNLAVLRRLVGRKRAPGPKAVEAWRAEARAAARAAEAEAGERLSVDRPGRSRRKAPPKRRARRKASGRGAPA